MFLFEFKFRSLFVILFLSDRVVEVLQETIDHDLANVTLDGVGGAPVPPTPTGILLPTPGTKDGNTDWSLEASVSVTIVLTILNVCYFCYKRFC